MSVKETYKKNNTEQNEVKSNISNRPFPKWTTAFVSQEWVSRISRRVHGGKTKGRPRFGHKSLSEVCSEGRPFTETTTIKLSLHFRRNRFVSIATLPDVCPHFKPKLFSEMLHDYREMVREYARSFPRAKGTGSLRIKPFRIGAFHTGTGKWSGVPN